MNDVICKSLFLVLG